MTVNLVWNSLQNGADPITQQHLTGDEITHPGDPGPGGSGRVFCHCRETISPLGMWGRAVVVPLHTWLVTALPWSPLPQVHRNVSCSPHSATPLAELLWGFSFRIAGCLTDVNFNSSCRDITQLLAFLLQLLIMELLIHEY